MKPSKLLLIILYACACETSAWADDFSKRLDAANYRIDTTEVGTVALDIDALAFFKDNEFDGDVVRGYSLPGFRVQPRVSFTPLPQIRLEAGFHATVYEGTNKYPSYVFHDIATWKGNKYQHGAHVLPFLRATASLGAQRRSQTTMVLGDIYGGMNHGVALPLWNPELTLTDDPEMGLQIIVDRKRWHSDVWLNWQSYIYEEDTHQEAFTVGWTQRVSLTSRQPEQCAAGHFYLPLQFVVQHRGGEQDVSGLGVQTVGNGAFGVGWEWRPQRNKVVTQVAAEALALGCLQQSGHLWPYDFGAALWAGASVELWHDLSIKAGCFHAPKQFCSLYGSPYFGTMSVKHPGQTFDGTTTGYWDVEYGRTFVHSGRRSHGTYTVGAKVDGYINHSRTPFCFGAYFRATPNFRWKVR